MKQVNIINAYQTIESLSEKDDISYSVLWDLFQLKNALQPHVEFFNQRLEAIRQKYIPKADENGQLSGKPYQEYLAEINELSEMDKDISDINKPVIKLKDIPGITLKMMDAMKDFVSFEKE